MIWRGVFIAMMVGIVGWSGGPPWAMIIAGMVAELICEAATTKKKM